jgi:dihydrofolate synthase/folylpolyglutamate synthase
LTDAATQWVASLSPWPERFGLERICALLHELGDPQRAFPAVHVVGTNGKSTTTRMTAALLADAGLAVGAYTSPHVSGWAERIQIRGEEADFERAVARVRPAAERTGATQFEVLTAAAFAAFAAEGVDAAVVEAGLGGRYDATNVLDARVVVLTNVSLEHTQVLGNTRAAIAAEKLAVVRPGAVVVSGEPEWEEAARAAGPARVEVTARSNLALAVAAAEAFLGRTVDPGAAETVALPGRLERRCESPLEIWDGAHTLAGLGWLLPRLPTGRYVVVASILNDKDPEGMLAALTAVGDTFVATQSSNARAFPVADLAALACRRFRYVEAVADPVEAAARGRELAGETAALLVTGSLYLLADLHAAIPSRSAAEAYHEAVR